MSNPVDPETSPEQQEPGTITPEDFIPVLGKPVVSTAALIVANCIPLVGALFFNWDVATILILYWLENVIVGVFNVLRMALVPVGPDGVGCMKFFMIPFFCFHYGMFCFVHGIFILVLSSAFMQGQAHGLVGPSFDPSPFNFGPLLAAMAARSGPVFPVAISGLIASHSISFALNYIGRGEYKSATVQDLMGQPYGRVVVMHITIVLGAFLLAATGGFKPAWLALLVVLKTGFDLKSHWGERAKLAKMKR